MSKHIISLNNVIDYTVPNKIERELVDASKGQYVNFEVWTLVLASGLEVKIKLYGSDGFNMENMLSGLKAKRVITIDKSQILETKHLFDGNRYLASQLEGHS